MDCALVIIHALAELEPAILRQPRRRDAIQQRGWRQRLRRLEGHPRWQRLGGGTASRICGLDVALVGLTALLSHDRQLLVCTVGGTGAC